MRNIITTAFLLFLYCSPLCQSTALASTDVSSGTEVVRKYNRITAKYLKREPEHENAGPVTRQISKVDACRLNKLCEMMSSKERFRNNFVVTKDRRLVTIGELLTERIQNNNANARRTSRRPAGPILMFIDNKASAIDPSRYDFRKNLNIHEFASFIKVAPDDIESVQVMNDVPSDAAKWASKAKGGVVFVTTKKADNNTPKKTR